MLPRTQTRGIHFLFNENSTSPSAGSSCPSGRTTRSRAYFNQQRPATERTARPGWSRPLLRSLRPHVVADSQHPCDDYRTCEAHHRVSHTDQHVRGHEKERNHTHDERCTHRVGPPSANRFVCWLVAGRSWRLRWRGRWSRHRRCSPTLFRSVSSQDIERCVHFLHPHRSKRRVIRGVLVRMPVPCQVLSNRAQLTGIRAGVNTEHRPGVFDIHEPILLRPSTGVP